MRALFGPILLTIVALAGLGAIVYFIMYFATAKVGLPSAYWLVPVFGAGGGVVGGIIRNDNALILARFENSSKILLGIIGDISVGMGGACAVAFVFGNTLRINPNDSLSNLLLVSMSFIAGVVGKQLVEVAGKRFLHEATEAGKAAGEKAAEQKVEKVKEDLTPIAVITYEQSVTQLNNQGLFTRALEMVQRLLAYDPDNIYAYVEKARALKRLGKVQEALDTVEQALHIQPDDVRLLYNRACYLAILNMSTERVFADLKTVCEAVPQYCEHARTDPDLKEVLRLKQFQDLMLHTLDEALRTHPENAPDIPLLRYSRACYRTRFSLNLSIDLDEILADLDTAFAANPKLKERAQNDLDLKELLSREEFKNLLFGT